MESFYNYFGQSSVGKLKNASNCENKVIRASSAASKYVYRLCCLCTLLNPPPLFNCPVPNYGAWSQATTMMLPHCVTACDTSCSVTLQNISCFGESAPKPQ